MSEKKELNKEELEKVSGGGNLGTTPESVNWLFNENSQVSVELTDDTKVTGKVTKRGYIAFPLMTIAYIDDYYYIESSANTNVNGWYAGKEFSNKTVSISKKMNGSCDPDIYAW